MKWEWFGSGALVAVAVLLVGNLMLCGALLVKVVRLIALDQRIRNLETWTGIPEDVGGAPR